MSKPTIDIFITAGETARLYAGPLYQSLEHFKSGNYDLRYKCVINTTVYDKIEHWDTVGINHNFQPYRFVGHGSYYHGLSLNMARDLTDADFTLMADADTAVLQKDWDEIMVSKIRKATVVAGVESNASARRYRGFPCAIFMMFYTKALKIVKPNFCPGMTMKGDKLHGFKVMGISSERQSALWGMKVGTKFRCDTGWELPAEFRGKGFNGYSFPHEEDAAKRKFHSYYECWYHNDTPFVLHCRGSRKHAYGKAGEWIKFVNKYLPQERHSVLPLPLTPDDREFLGDDE